MLSRAVQRSLVSLRHAAPRRVATQRRWLTPAPTAGETLMERRADRELPNIETNSFRWSRSLPIFAALIAISSFAIFNYQKSSSSVVASTLYALRTSPLARSLLGEEIYFKRRIPYIAGDMNPLQGRIDISFTVKGSKASGVMTFKSFRPDPKGLFQTEEWSLVMESGELAGKKVDLLEGGDPFKAIPGAHMLEDEE
ncbi:related to FMP35 Found in Mitochondrial Proteome [Cephalotrichum gorgonifer]|uniref:Related to FMP35 Found in Mitochondrial Proteome n=1 Tax=Cephalotrichum gorgonifer TaxID=2041049 RepID=A0AAE8N011_9PEZI|nr:related to FMP35 Found in Mitochondrial Proteome [Cephalotrichum gorgonifer]